MRYHLRVSAPVLFGLALAACFPAAGGHDVDADWPRTRAERSDYQETSRYDEVVAFMEAVAGRSDRVHLTTFGFTNEGRPLPLAVVGDVADASPEAVADSGRLRLYLQGNIHAGEVCGKEALLELLRELAQGGHSDWDDEVVLLVAPIYNADGNERFGLANRPGQNGPFGGMGQRPNAQGLDLNRDHMKVESPEARSLLGLLNSYDPHVGVDLHTTNGTRHAYHLTYSPPLNPNTHPAIDSLLRDEWLPTITEKIRERDGEEFYYYGNLPFRGGMERGWYTFDHRPRFNNNYIGLRNRIAILSEAYAYATFAERVASSRRFVEEIVDFAAANADSIREAIDTAESAPVAGQELALRAIHERSAEPVEILLGEAELGTHPLTGRRVARRLDVRTPESMYEFGTFAPTEVTRAPSAYLVPAELSAVIERLRLHGIRMSSLDQETTVTVERFRISGSTVAEREFQGHRERSLAGAYETVEMTLPAGTVRVEADQPLGRLAFYLLEPMSDDGLTSWNFLDVALEGAAHYPIVRIPAQ